MAALEARLIEIRPDVAINIVVTTPTTSEYSPITVVFLHFWGGSSSTWSYVTPFLSHTYPTIAFDFRGWGDSTGPANRMAYSTAHLADDVQHVLNELKPKSFILVGLSMGAKVAQCLAGRRSLPALRGIVLISPAPPTPLVLPAEMREQQIHAFDNALTAEFVARNVLTATALEDSIVEALVRDMLRGNEFARAAWPAYAAGEDISTIVERIEVPALVVAAENDVVEPPAKVKKDVVDQLRRVEFVVVANSGHLSPVETPKDVGGFVRNFLEGV